MPGKWPWFERKFNFDFPTEKYPDIVERLRGTPARVEELTGTIPADVLTRRDADTWSIQENAGHLADAEPLWAGRIEDILGGADVMREADLTNTKTHNANHNARSLGEVTASFRTLRTDLIRRLESLSDAGFAKSSIHPRTKLRMRVVDLCTFVADHDDYHLARISELRHKFAP
jgi:uncharacterized damage-inducible protein DinB